ncbi:MAG: TetR/AcrR family transcriptional regulator [Burkholderiales bacterium]|nr:TetR/AcrR family transcriptional regulator [Burkholderiales bacterium]
MTLFKNFRCPAAALREAAAGGRTRQRAMDGDDKEARRQAILDAAERLFADRHELVNVADVAEAAGLAKGTVYLYFQTKEEIYLALHLRHVERFFTTLIHLLESGQPFAFEQLHRLTDEHMVRAPIYMPLGACCIGFAPDAVPIEAAGHFQAQLTHWLIRAGRGLEHHFPKLPAGEGARLLKHSYAMMIGMYSLMRGTEAGDPKCPVIPGMGSYEDEVALALTRYWAHVAGIADGSADALGRIQR